MNMYKDCNIFVTAGVDIMVRALGTRQLRGLRGEALT